MQHSGIVSVVKERPFGTKTFYSFALSGQDGFFGTGLKKPPAVGSSITFEAQQNARGFTEVDTKSIQFRIDGKPTTASVGAASVNGGAKGTNGGTQAGYWEARANRDLVNDALRELGASRNTAIAIVDLMLKHEALKLPAAAKREAFIWETVKHYTEKLMAKSDPVESTETIVESTEVDPTTEDADWN